ncbi:MAG: LysR family transcriptional regulator [Parvibaculum sp.]|uniref:LysR family transcriptional regulator n=1 Tax=Parvibaculum sp. TaxID=2024848 RepID=UPI0028420596|nr:LysR family transcriptional regulator [Parvibaculum sp.]MDR3499836.1 LysR family transcriptional regulator [Parvibaculum sp.]
MDIDLARTFLDVVSTGSFVRAAERLNITQTAVSARIKALEDQIGRSLFVRNKAGARLTPAGNEFIRFAASLVQIWERARQQVALPPGREAMVAIGGELSLWNPLLLNWLIWMRREAPEIALRTQVDLGERLIEKVQAGVLDIAIMYAPSQRPGIQFELLLEERLIAVSTDPEATEVTGGDYVQVDWGPDFAAHHEIVFPHLRDAGSFVGLGPLALQYILAVGGSGYFRTRAVRRYLDDGTLHRVRNAPEFSFSIYALSSAQSDGPAVQTARRGLRMALDAEAEGWAQP